MLLPLPGAWTTDIASANRVAWEHLWSQDHEALVGRYSVPPAMALQLLQLSAAQVATVAYSPVLHMRATPTLTDALATLRRQDSADTLDRTFDDLGLFNATISSWVRERLREDFGLATLLVDIPHADALALRDMDLHELRSLSTLGVFAHWAPIDSPLLIERLVWVMGDADPADLDQLDRMLCLGHRSRAGTAAP